MERVLVIDDDVELCELVAEYLEPEGFDVDVADDGLEGVGRALAGDYAIIVLDVMLPGINGFEVLRRVRAKSRTPVLMLTARGADVDRIVGLELGADDYLPKPFNPRELVARIQAILRRTRGASSIDAQGSPSETITVGDVRLDTGARTAHRHDEAIDLTAAEFEMLAVLLAKAGRVVAREELAEAALGRPLAPLDRSVDMHISSLRKKLGYEVDGIERIKTVRGAGYVYTK
ncbi:MAG: response regulator transcription factor [Pyrinomonadaceae bacterium MAG19_C2-C3]|nr:response regulator transcription factor [Pyrinomonadaceae bacterium MAG19_C2-C3]